MSIGGTHDHLIIRLYDAATRPDLWPSVLRSMADLLRADVSILFTVDFLSDAPSIIHSTDHGPPLVSFMTEHMDNPWSRASLRNPAGTIARTESLVPLDELRRSGFYADVLEPAGLFFSLGGNLVNEDGVLGCFSFLRSMTDEEFSGTEMETMGRLMPHFQKAAEVTLKLAEVDLMQRAALEALHRLGVPLFLVDDECKVVFANGAAEDLLRSQHDLLLRRGKLQTSSSTANARLERALGEVSRDGGTHPAHDHVAVPVDESPLPLVLSIAPLGDLGLRAAGRRPVAALFVGERSLPLLPTERALVQTFGLTSTEARVARLVATGQGLDAAAHELGVSRNTVRTHLARVFGKTGTKRQAELTSILHSAFPPVRDPSNRRG